MPCREEEEEEKSRSDEGEIREKQRRGIWGPE
jgi:hypothetical protein